MKRRLLTILLSLTFISSIFTGCGTPSHAKELTADTKTKIPVDAANMDSIQISMQPVQQFGYKLLSQSLEDKNPVLSPVSAYMALCMLEQGAAGKTKEELQAVLGGGMDIPYHLMQTLPQEKERAQCRLANSAWLDEMFEAQDEWLGTVRGLLDADVYQTDLGTKEAADDINKWVSECTEKMIPTLLEKPLDKNARLALLNAVYFHADWEQAFDAEDTWQGKFHTEQGTVQTAQMMTKTFDACRYLKDDMAQGILLPYADSDFVFAAVMPVHGETIRDWYASYSADKLEALLQNGEQQTVMAVLPKFKACYKKRLDDSLKNMGITLAFDANQADLTSIGKDKSGANLYVNLVLQEAVIQVAEKGTEAAAASAAVVAAGGAMPDSIQEMIFDRPFLYGIWDMESGAPVFMGILDKPVE